MAESPVNDAPFRLISDVEFGEGVIVHPFTNVYGCSIGDESRIGPFVEIQAGARIGARCKVQTNVWLCTLQRAPTRAPRWISTNGPIRVSSPISQP